MFTFPVGMMAQSGGGGSDPDGAGVQLLLHGNGDFGSTTFTDSSTFARVPVQNGGVYISTDESRWGGSSLFFNGSTYLDYAGSSGFNISSSTDFTFEAWVWISSIGTTSNAVLLEIRTSTGTAFDTVLLTFKLAEDFLGNSVIAYGFTQGTTALTRDAWNYVAWVKSGGTVTGYINSATPEFTYDASFDSFPEAVTYVRLGGSCYVDPYSASPTSGLFFGYIDDLRLTIGTARTIAVPTAQFPDP